MCSDHQDFNKVIKKSTCEEVKFPNRNHYSGCSGDTISLAFA